MAAGLTNDNKDNILWGGLGDLIGGLAFALLTVPFESTFTLDYNMSGELYDPETKKTIWAGRSPVNTKARGDSAMSIRDEFGTSMIAPIEDISRQISSAIEKELAPAIPSDQSDSEATETAPGTPRDEPSIKDRLRELKELLDEKLITPEEYEKKKKELLEQL